MRSWNPVLQKELDRQVLPGRHNVEEFLHGYCDLYLAYFLARNPGWSGCCIRRRKTGRIVHAYAMRKDDAGAVVYADARGVFTSPSAFFRPYHFREKDVEREILSEGELADCRRRILDLELGPAIETLYRYIYE